VNIMNKKRIAFGVVGALLVLLLLGAGIFVVWANNAAPPMPEALAAMQSDSTVQFSEQNGWLVFQPVGTLPASGLVIYPGGKVDYRAYAPTAKAIAAQGHLVVIPPMPLNLAFFDMNAAEKIIQAFPQIQKWAVAGHSLGGVAASSYAAKNPDKIQGIGFWASYPQVAMTTYPGKVSSISATNDGLATPEKIEASKKDLPAATTYVPIQGGNHAQFGYYGPQEGDNPATISRAEQQKQLVAEMVKLLQSLQ
jgi:hypothetical protein